MNSQSRLMQISQSWPRPTRRPETAPDGGDVHRMAHKPATTGYLTLLTRRHARPQDEGSAIGKQRRFTSGVLPACARATCTDSTDHRTDRTQDAGIIRHAVPRTVPRPRRRRFRKEALIGVIVDRQGSDAGVGTPRGSRLTGADGQRVRMPTVTHCVWRSTRYPPICTAAVIAWSRPTGRANGLFCVPSRSGMER